MKVSRATPMAAITPQGLKGDEVLFDGAHDAAHDQIVTGPQKGFLDVAAL